jgi:hypothetical protein
MLDIGLDNNFLDVIPKIQIGIKIKNGQDYIKLKSFCTAIETKRQLVE